MIGITLLGLVSSYVRYTYTIIWCPSSFPLSPRRAPALLFDLYQSRSFSIHGKRGWAKKTEFPLQEIL